MPLPLCQSKSKFVLDDDQVSKIPLPMQMDGKVVKEGVFPCRSRGKDSYRVFLTTQELILQPLTKDDEQKIERYRLQDLFGVQTLQHEKKTERTTAYICFYLYPKLQRSISFLSKSELRERTPLVFCIQKPGKTLKENIEFANEWRDEALNIICTMFPSHGQNGKRDTTDNGQLRNKLQEVSDIHIAMSSYKLLRRQYLIFLNPNSGQGKAISIYDEKIAPLLVEAGITPKLVVTKSVGHAESYVSSNDLDGIHGICTVGGDGTLFEVVNALRRRDDASEYYNLPVGTIAGGSGNGLARSLAAYVNDGDDYMKHPQLYTSLVVARGRVVDINLVEVEIDSKKYYAFLSVGWGLLADIDIESEVLRALGEPRFTIWSILRLVKLKSYKATFSYIPLPTEQVKSPKETKIEGEFLSIFASLQSYIGSDLFFAPDATPNDGCVHLTYILASGGRTTATLFLHRLDSGSHLTTAGVAYEKVKEFTIEQKGGLGGNITLDGERVTAEKLTVRMCPHPLKVFSL